MKVLALTSIRSEYDLMSPLLARLRDDPAVELRLLVGGAHNSASFGATYRDIEADGYDVLLRIESLLDADTPSARIKSAAVLLLSAVDAVRGYAPDLILYAGDREEVLIGAMLGGYLGIPTAHLYAGDHAADGYIDNPVRHATSKLSTIQLVSTREHHDRLRAIGEPEDRIFVVGSIALDRFADATPVPGIVERIAGRPVDRPAALFIYHPFGDEAERAAEIVTDAVGALVEEGFHVFAGSPNSDAGNRAVRDAIQSAAGEHCTVYGNLPGDEFVALFKSVSTMAGNSSAGLLEAASIPIPVVNIGGRQRGRLAGPNVLFVSAERDQIRAGIARAASAEFRAALVGMSNPYGDGRSAEAAHRLITTLDLTSMLAKPEDPLDDRA
jgi:UDP-hydrolysing UDP-N-acetyl-D-glucosamine 2-epimerase